MTTLSLHATETVVILHADQPEGEYSFLQVNYFLIDEAPDFLIDEAGDFLVSDLDALNANILHTTETQVILHAEA